MRYWDSSALVSLIVRESDTEQRERLQRQDGGIVTWWGTLIECASALSRLQREGSLDSRSLTLGADKLRRSAANWLQIRPSERLRQRALRLLRLHPLRAADALQLAAALVACDDDPTVLALVCSDQGLSDAALTEGFVVL